MNNEVTPKWVIKNLYLIGWLTVVILMEMAIIIVELIK